MYLPNKLVVKKLSKGNKSKHKYIDSRGLKQQMFAESGLEPLSSDDETDEFPTTLFYKPSNDLNRKSDRFF